jgi:transposase-like protein
MRQKERDKLKEELKGKNIHTYMENLYKDGIEALLEAELDEHLGYEKHDKNKSTDSNSRNGTTQKQIQTKLGEYIIEVPRDRNGSFSPELVPKRKRVLDMIEEKILLLYTKGMSVRDIRATIGEIYGVEMNKDTITRFTDKIMPKIEQWCNRPLDSFYFIVWMDGIRIKVKENHRLVEKSIYIAMGLNSYGRKEVLGIWINEVESASYWLEVLSDMKARGVSDIIFTATDNLTGFTSAIQSSFPSSITQLCVVHQIRNSLKYVANKDKKQFSYELKNVYQAPNKKLAEKALEQLEVNWGDKYKTSIKGWINTWENLSNYFNYPLEIRKLIYTTNIIENLNKNIRKYTKCKTQFPNKNSALKSVYLACRNTEKVWYKPIPNWGMILNQFKTIFEDRCENIEI